MKKIINLFIDLVLFVGLLGVVGLIIYLFLPVLGINFDVETDMVDLPPIAVPSQVFSPLSLAIPASAAISAIQQETDIPVAYDPVSLTIPYSQDNGQVLIINIPETTILVQVEGKVHAGYSTANITGELQERDGKVILILYLPEPVILSWEKDVDESGEPVIDPALELWIVQVGAVRGDTMKQIDQKTRDEAYVTACKHLILDKTNVEAVAFFNRLFRPTVNPKQYGYDAVEIVTTAPGECP